MRCVFCKRELPEPGASHVIFARGRLHAVDPDMPPEPICAACCRYHKWTMARLVRSSSLRTSSEYRTPKVFGASAGPSSPPPEKKWLPGAELEEDEGLG